MAARFLKKSINIFKTKKLRLKFFFTTNYSPKTHTKLRVRKHFCSKFYIYMYILFFFLQSVNLKKLNWDVKKTIFSTNTQYKLPLSFLYNKSHVENTDLSYKNESFRPMQFSINTQKSYNFLTYKSFYTLVKPLKRTQFCENINFHILLFVKKFNHFIILRAPFRHKISKNILGHQRFYIFINTTIQLHNEFIFSNKLYLVQFLINFSMFFFLSSNILILHSKKINFFIYFPNFFQKFLNN